MKILVDEMPMDKSDCPYSEFLHLVLLALTFVSFTTAISIVMGLASVHFL